MLQLCSSACVRDVQIITTEHRPGRNSSVTAQPACQIPPHRHSCGWRRSEVSKRNGVSASLNRRHIQAVLNTDMTHKSKSKSKYGVKSSSFKPAGVRNSLVTHLSARTEPEHEMVTWALTFAGAIAPNIWQWCLFTTAENLEEDGLKRRFIR